MIGEWKRMLLDRTVIAAAILLLVGNVLMFIHVSLDSSIVETRNETMGRIRLLQDHQDLEEQLAENEVIVGLFDFRRFKEAFPEDYALHELEAEMQIRKEHDALADRFDRGEFDEAESRQQAALLRTVYDSVVYAQEYRERIDAILSNAQNMSAIGIFQGADTSAVMNIQKTAEDYGGLRSISITPGNDDSTVKLLEYGLMPVAGILFAVVLVSQVFEEQKYGLRLLIFSCRHGRASLTLWRAAGLLVGSILFSLMLYGSVMLADLYLFGPIDAQRTAQSVPALFGVTVPLTLGQFWLLYLIGGFMAQIMVTGLVWFVFSVLEHRAMAMGVLAGILGGSVLVYRMLPEQSAVSFLKYANPAAVLDPGTMLSTYQNDPLGPVLLEKNWLAAGMMAAVLLTSFSAAVWCGICRRSVSTHGRVYRVFRAWLQKLSRLYHRGVSRLPFLGIEAYKVLVIQRGVLVLAALVLMAFQVYQTTSAVYVGEGEFMRDFYGRYAGEGITGEVTAYSDALRSDLARVEAEWTLAVEDHQNDRISLEEYELSFRKYEAYEVYRRGLAAIESAVAYIQDQSRMGYEAVLVDPTAYEYLLKSDRVMELTTFLAAVILCAGVFSVEKRRGLLRVLHTTQNGRMPLAFRKALMGLFFSLIVYGACTAVKIYSVFASYGLPSLDAPAHSLTIFSQCPVNWSIGTVMMMYTLSKWLVCAAFGLFACMLSARFSHELSICCAGAAFMVPEGMEMIGMDVFNLWSVQTLEENAVSGIVSGKWGTLLILAFLITILMICTCLIWEKGRMRKK